MSKASRVAKMVPMALAPQASNLSKLTKACAAEAGSSRDGYLVKVMVMMVVVDWVGRAGERTKRMLC